MENKINYCHNCGAENKITSKYCKLCGTTLNNIPEKTPAELPFEETIELTETTAIPENTVFKDTVSNSSAQPVATKAPVSEQKAKHTADTDNSFGETFKEYMGRSSKSLYKKYIKHQKGQSVWNWAVFFFTLLGLPFVWFFYRKMNNVAVTVLAIWFALTATSAVAGVLVLNEIQGPFYSFVSTTVSLAEKDFKIVAGKIIGNNSRTIVTEFNKMLDIISENELFWVFISIFALTVILKIIFLFVISGKANKLYFKHMEKDVRQLQNSGASIDDIRNAGSPDAPAATISGFILGAVIFLTAAIPLIVIFVEFLPFVFDSIIRLMKRIGLGV